METTPAPACLTDVLPSEVLSLVLYHVSLAHHIGRVALTSRAVSIAARNAIKARSFSSEIVTLAGHTYKVMGVAAAPDGRIITGADDHIVKVWRDGVCERTVQAHTDWVRAVACCRAERASSAPRKTAL